MRYTTVAFRLTIFAAIGFAVSLLAAIVSSVFPLPIDTPNPDRVTTIAGKDTGLRAFYVEDSNLLLFTLYTNTCTDYLILHGVYQVDIPFYTEDYIKQERKHYSGLIRNMQRIGDFRLNHKTGTVELTSTIRHREYIFTGWPMRCLVCKREKKSHIQGGIANPYKKQNTTTAIADPAADPAMIPLTPLWRGLAINTLFYAAVSAAIWYTIIFLKRWNRARHGRCPRCGYDLSGITAAVCPECGARPALHARREQPA